MSSNGVDTSTPARRRVQLSRLAIRLLIAVMLLILSVTIVLAFFASRVVSH
jgi:hypothetical protein